MMWFLQRKFILLLGLFIGSLSLISSGYSTELGKVRFSPLSGSWYPADPDDLRKMLMGYLDKARITKIKGRILAIISPHAGYQFSGQAAAHGFKAIRGRDYNRVMVIGPSHYAGFHGICVSSYDYYETPLGKVPVEKGVRDELSRHNLFISRPDAEAREHSLEMELPFLQIVLDNFKIIPLIVGELEEKEYNEVAKLLRPYITEKTLVIISSDFTHFGRRFNYLPFTENIKDNLKKLDLGAVDYILKKDFNGYLDYLQETGVTICGRIPIGILLRLLPSEAEGLLLDYYTSGDILNDYASTVSYVSIVFKNSEIVPSQTLPKKN